MALPSPLPDSPTRWDGWRCYNSANLYERLCLDISGNPTNFQIEDNCRQLLIWWQKKLPLKNQPSNPIAQMLRAGMDEAPRFLAEARTDLLDPEIRERLDARLRAEIKEKAITEFLKYFSFTVNTGTLAEEDEKNLHRVGQDLGLGLEETKIIVEEQLQTSGAKRFVKPEPPPAAASSQEGFRGGGDPFDEFRRMLKLTNLGDDDMTDDQRDALCNMGESLGLTGGQAEDLIDEYLEQGNVLAMSKIGAAAPAVLKKPEKKVVVATQKPPTVEKVPSVSPLSRVNEKNNYPNFQSSVGTEMLLVSSGSFFMGSAAFDAAPNEQPISKILIKLLLHVALPHHQCRIREVRFPPCRKARRGSR